MALTDNLNAYYKLDESSGNAADSTGNGYTLTNNNTTTFAAAKINNGAVFNGSNQYLNSASIELTTNAWSINVWLNPDDADIANQTFYSYRPASGAVNIIQCEGLSTRAIRCIVYSSNGTSYKDYRTSLTLTQSAWNMFTLTWDGTTLTPYINGTADTSITKTKDDAVTQTLTARVLRLGAETAASNFFDGNEDEFGIWSRALTSTEVSTLYNSGSGNQYPFSAAYSLVCARGQFTLTGISNTITKALKSIMSAGSFTLTGINASFSRGKKLICDVGEFVLTGSDTLLKRAYTLVASAGEFTLTGINVIILKALKMIASTGVYALTFKDFIIKGWDIITNIARPSSSIINSSKVIGGETWDTNPYTWDEETRTWDASGTLWTNGTRPTTTITNITKG